jgi:hypothetical protein
MLQEEPAAIEEPQVLPVMVKSPGLVPVKPKLVKLAVPEPPAFTLKVLVAAAEPTVCEAHDSEDGLNVIVVVGGGVPVPVRATFCGLLLAPSVMVRFAVRVPVAVGAKIR